MFAHTVHTSHPSDSVASLMAWPVASVDVDSTLLATAEALAEDEVGALAVLDDRDGLVGVISERDVVRHVAAGADLRHTRAREVMSVEPVTVSSTETLRHAARLMCDAQVRHLPVLDGEELVGFLSLRDLLEAYVESAQHVEGQPL